jgi:hypothetical protein
MLYIVPWFPLPELSSIVSPKVLSMFHWATIVVAAATDGKARLNAKAPKKTLGVVLID